MKKHEDAVRQWKWTTTTIEVPEAYRSKRHRYVRMATHPSFEKGDLVLVDVSFWGEYVYDQLRKREECKSYRIKAIDERVKDGTFNKGGMYWKLFDLSYKFENEEFQEALIYVIEEALISRGAKKREKMKEEEGKPDIHKYLTAAGILATVYENPQVPHTDAKNSTKEDRESKKVALPWSGILPLLDSGSRLLCYGKEEAAVEDPVFLNIPPRTLLLFG